MHYFFFGKACFQQRIYNGIEKSFGSIFPTLICFLAKPVIAIAWRGHLCVCPYANVFSSNDVHYCPDIFCIVKWRICKMCPNTYNASCVGKNFSLLFADKSWQHHFGHFFICPQLSSKSCV